MSPGKWDLVGEVTGAESKSTYSGDQYFPVYFHSFDNIFFIMELF